MKLLFVALAILLSFTQVSKSYALSVYCANCSNMWTQALDRVTNVEQLKTMTLEYAEAVKQTYQQIELVKNNILQYENMLKNTENLPKNLINMLSNDLSKLALTTNSLSTMKADVSAMEAIYDNLYPSQEYYGDLSGLGFEYQEDNNVIINTEFDAMSMRIDDATKATFQLSGKQLNDLQNSGELQSHINNLLSTPTGQMQALSSANQLASLQIQETRQLREMLATQAQSNLATQVRDEKEKQLSKELAREIIDMSDFETKSNLEELPMY